MSDENNEAEDVEEHEEEGGDDLCDEKTKLGQHEISSDEDLPAATGGVEEQGE
jgi:hypothetical protein